jgi:hypothetical protein
VTSIAEGYRTILCDVVLDVNSPGDILENSCPRDVRINRMLTTSKDLVSFKKAFIPFAALILPLESVSRPKRAGLSVVDANE